MVRAKIFFEDEIRAGRVNSFQHLTRKIESTGIVGYVTIDYKDSEGDWISLASQDDWEEAEYSANPQLVIRVKVQGRARQQAVRQKPSSCTGRNQNSACCRSRKSHQGAQRCRQYRGQESCQARRHAKFQKMRAVYHQKVAEQQLNRRRALQIQEVRRAKILASKRRAQQQQQLQQQQFLESFLMQFFKKEEPARQGSSSKSSEATEAPAKKAVQTKTSARKSRFPTESESVAFLEDLFSNMVCQKSSGGTTISVPIVVRAASTKPETKEASTTEKKLDQTLDEVFELVNSQSESLATDLPKETVIEISDAVEEDETSQKQIVEEQALEEQALEEQALEEQALEEQALEEQADDVVLELQDLEEEEALEFQELVEDNEDLSDFSLIPDVVEVDVQVQDAEPTYENEIRLINQMGFDNEQLIKHLLNVHHGDTSKTVSHLLMVQSSH